MSMRNLRPLLWIGLFFLQFQQSSAAYLNRPELVDYNFAGASICDQVDIRIKFDYENFNAGNVFTAELSNATGSFNSPTTLVGTLVSSGSQQNVFFTVSFPAGVPPGNNYRIRIRGSNPLTYSNQPNEYPFSVSNISATNTEAYPTGFWRGSMFTWTPSTSGTISDANTEDIFNPANYVGYITEDTMSFDFNWSNNIPAPANLPDTVKVCGTYLDKFSLRMKRRVTFEAGYYVFGGGADDGFRLSIDGGSTWIINDWNDHSYRGSLLNNGCGILLTAGERDVVCEFYENGIDARFRCIIIKTGDPAINPPSITFPANGAVFCSSAAPVQMIANPPGAWQWTGPGVSSNGILNPGIGPAGPRTISYTTGYAAFGQNCVKNTSVSVTIAPALSAQFSGPDSVYCVTQTTGISLVAQNPGGVFSGSGVTGNSFVPSAAGPGFHAITHILTSGGCADTVTKLIHIYAPIPVSINPLPVSVCANSGPYALSASVTGGTFSGPGVVGNNWTPVSSGAGINTITYILNQGGCTNTAQASVNVQDAPNAAILLPETSFCKGSKKVVKVTATPAGGFILNGEGWLGDSLYPDILGAGDYTLIYVAGPAGCVDTAYQTFTVNPLPNASFSTLPDSICVGTPNLTLVPVTAGGQFVGQGIILPNQFSPGLLIPSNQYEIEYRVTQNGCFNRSVQYIYILEKLKPSVSFPVLKSRYCTLDQPFSPASQPPGSYFLNGQPITEINPSALAPGNYVLKSVYRPATDLGCIDSASAIFPFSVIANPRPELGPDKEAESGLLVTLNPGIASPYVWTTNDQSITLAPNQPAQFTPTGDIEISILATDPTGTCSGSDVVKLTYRPALVFTNLFTPNADDKNDSWEIIGAYPDMGVTIFDRWGKKIYAGKTNGNLAWNGDGASETGIYFFLVENPGDGRKWNGWVQLAK